MPDYILTAFMDWAPHYFRDSEDAARMLSRYMAEFRDDPGITDIGFSSLARTWGF